MPSPVTIQAERCIERAKKIRKALPEGALSFAEKAFTKLPLDLSDEDTVTLTIAAFLVAGGGKANLSEVILKTFDFE